MLPSFPDTWGKQENIVKEHEITVTSVFLVIWVYCLFALRAHSSEECCCSNSAWSGSEQQSWDQCCAFILNAVWVSHGSGQQPLKIHAASGQHLKFKAPQITGDIKKILAILHNNICVLMSIYMMKSFVFYLYVFNPDIILKAAKSIRTKLFHLFSSKAVSGFGENKHQTILPCSKKKKTNKKLKNHPDMTGFSPL